MRKNILNIVNKYRDANMLIYWEDGLAVKCKLSHIEEKDNGLTFDDPDYLKYKAAYVKVLDLIKPSGIHKIYEGDYKEISVLEEPLRIELEDGTVVWEKEKMWNSLLDILDDYGGKRMLIYWEDGLVILCKLDDISEKDNGLELEDPDYIEYYAAYVKILEIIHPAKNPDPYTYVGNSKEVSEEKEPLRIVLEDGTVIWEK